MENLNWQDFLNKIVQQQGQTNLNKFGQIPEDKEKVLFCLHDKQLGKQLDKWLDKNNPSNEHKKNTQVYTKSKADGNSAYVKKNNQHAIKCYNDALLHAREGLEEAFIFGNRSAVLFSEGRFEESIIDINLAINNGFPIQKAFKLYKRKAEALIKLNRNQEVKQCLDKAIFSLQQVENSKIEIKKLNELRCDLDLSKDSPVKTDIQIEVLPLCGGCNSNMTSASSYLTRCFDENRGRYVVANQDIAKGSVIISEPPYAAVLLKPWYLTHCQHCYQKVDLPIPCHQCSEVCYCSEKCRQISFEQYHYFECGKLELLEKLGISRLAVRIVLITPIKTLRQFQNASNKMVIGLNSGCDGNGVYNVDYRSVYHLVTNSDSMLVEDVFQYSCAAAVLLKCLERYSSIESSDSHFIGGLLLRHIQQLVCNAHAITGLSICGGDSKSIVVEESQVRIATAIYPTTSLLNHSCQPSIVNTFQKDRLVVKLADDIKKGQEIFNCYGPHQRRMDFEQRQQVLKQQYFFDCKCMYCVKGAVSLNQYNCFSCTQCEGNLDNEGYCSKCDKHQRKRIRYCQNIQQECTEMFQKALSLISYYELAINNNEVDNEIKDSLEAALHLLNRCLKSRASILYKHHKDLGETNDAIGKCYALLHDYEASVSHVTQSIAVVELHFGKDSIEVPHELLKLSDVYMALIQQLIDDKNKEKIRETLEPFGIPTIKRTLKLVELNKSRDDEDVKLLKERLSSLKKLKFLCKT